MWLWMDSCISAQVIVTQHISTYKMHELIRWSWISTLLNMQDGLNVKQVSFTENELTMESSECGSDTWCTWLCRLIQWGFRQRTCWIVWAFTWRCFPWTTTITTGSSWKMVTGQISWSMKRKVTVVCSRKSAPHVLGSLAELVVVLRDMRIVVQQKVRPHLSKQAATGW